MRLACPSCGAARQPGLDSCPFCRAAYPPIETEAEPLRPEVPQPSGVTVEDRGSELQIVHRWFSPLFLFLAVFCVIWFGFLLFWYGMVFTVGAPLLFALFPLLHLGVGVGLAYYTLCGFVNRTTVLVGSGDLSIAHGPLPWPGNRTIDAKDVRQLYCSERVHRGKNGSHTSYELNALTSDGRKLKLLSGLSEHDHALYFEQQLERHLGIRDQRVKGESG